MPSRAPHMKSRNGCTLCKAKRVKCDESKPSCSRCIRVGSKCQYHNTSFKSAFSPGSSLPSTSCTVPSSSPDKESNSPPSPSLYQKHFSTKDLELVFHYTVSTSFTLATKNSDGEPWQLIAPQEAFSDPFLTYGLLSISSLHIAHLRPSDAELYNDLGVQHYNSAVELFKPALHCLDPGNADSITTFITLIGYISMAIQEPPIASDYIEVVLAKFSSLYVVRDLIQSVWPMLEASPTRSWPFVNAETQGDAPSFSAEVALDALEWRIHAEVESEMLRSEYVTAIQYLRYFLQHKIHVLTWPLLISEQFCQAMKKREPAAITILGFYGTLLHTSESAWWMGDKGSRIVLATSAIVSPEWQNLIKWASMFVNIPQRFMSASPSVENELLAMTIANE